MDFNTYATEKMVAGRLADLRAASARAALIQALGSPRGVGSTVGSALIRLGHWLGADEAAAAPNAGVRVAR